MLNYFKFFLSRFIKPSFQNNQKNSKNLNPKIETDVKKIIEEAAKGNKKIITPTQILICVMHSVYDSRFDREFMHKLGLYHKGMPREESIVAALAFLVLFAFENKFSTALVISFLNKYCINGATEIFIYYYKALAQSNNIDISETLFNDNTLSVELDIGAYAKTQSLNDNITFDMPFREPYVSMWNSAFAEIK